MTTHGFAHPEYLVDTAWVQSHWEDDGVTGGLATRAHVTQPRRIWVGEQLVEVESGAEFALQREYRIVLSGEADPWTPEHASRLLDAMRALRPPAHAGAAGGRGDGGRVWVGGLCGGPAGGADGGRQGERQRGARSRRWWC